MLKELKGWKDSFLICVPKPESDTETHGRRRDSTPRKYLLAPAYAWCIPFPPPYTNTQNK